MLARAKVMRGLSVATAICSAAGEPAGSYNSIRTFGRVPRARSIIGRTSLQSRPPLPHPSGGTASDVMFRRLTCATRSCRPDSISRIRDRLFPVTLGREINDVLWTNKASRGVDGHASELNVPILAGAFIELKVLRELILELKRNSLAHYPDAIDGIDQGLGFGLKDVPTPEFNHSSYLSSTRLVWFARQWRRLQFQGDS